MKTQAQLIPEPCVPKATIKIKFIPQEGITKKECDFCCLLVLLGNSIVNEDSFLKLPLNVIRHFQIL